MSIGKFGCTRIAFNRGSQRYPANKNPTPPRPQEESGKQANDQHDTNVKVTSGIPEPTKDLPLQGQQMNGDPANLTPVLQAPLPQDNAFGELKQAQGLFSLQDRMLGTDGRPMLGAAPLMCEPNNLLRQEQIYSLLGHDFDFANLGPGLRSRSLSGEGEAERSPVQGRSTLFSEDV